MIDLTCSDSQCLFLKMCKLPELCFFCCRPFNQSHHSSALYFQSRLELKRAVSVCTCGGVMGGMRRQLQTLQWHRCNGADWSPIWPPAGPSGFSIQQPPNPPSQRHCRHYRANLGGSPSPIDFNLATVLTLAAQFSSTPVWHSSLLPNVQKSEVQLHFPSVKSWHFLSLFFPFRLSSLS